MPRTVNQYVKDTYGRKLYKISINAGFTCPNRDGTCGMGGCIFCSEGGSGDFAGNPVDSVLDQIEAGKEFLAKKFQPERSDSYIAYFQAFTNTYAPVEKLRPLYEEAISHEDVVLVSIATRPDCLGRDVLDLLSEMNEKKPVWVELGLQTSKESSAEFIRRGYPNGVYEKAVKNLKARGIKVITHVILGLPGESYEDMERTVRYVVEQGSWGIKLQLLHVLSCTDLGRIYERDPFYVFTMEEYVDCVARLCALLPEDMVVHRLTGDGPRSLLLAPTWSTDKKRVLNALRKRLDWL